MRETSSNSIVRLSQNPLVLLRGLPKQNVRVYSQALELSNGRSFAGQQAGLITLIDIVGVEPGDATHN